MAKRQLRKSFKQETMAAPPSFNVNANGAGERASQHDIAALAYALWQARGCPDGTPETDWYCAEQQLTGHESPRVNLND